MGIKAWQPPALPCWALHAEILCSTISPAFGKTGPDSQLAKQKFWLNAHLMQWQQFVLSKNYPSPVFFLSFFFFFLCTRKNTYSFERPICSFPSTCRSESGLTSAPQLLSLSRFLCRAICHTPVLASFPSHQHAAEQTTAPRWKSSIPVPLGALQSSPPA